VLTLAILPTFGLGYILRMREEGNILKEKFTYKLPVHNFFRKKFGFRNLMAISDSSELKRVV
jgi:hypothetical protein